MDDTDLRVGLWAPSLASDVTGTLFAANTGFKISAAHFAERYGLFIIIALADEACAEVAEDRGADDGDLRPAVVPGECCPDRDTFPGHPRTRG